MNNNDHNTTNRNDRVPMTTAGKQALEKNLASLMAKRPEVINAIAVARAHGDLRENAEYHAARERQSMSEARITDIQYKLSMAQIIDVSTIPNSGKVIFGVTVELCNLGNNDLVSYQIVGQDESNVDANLIAYTAPIARALIGKKIGDKVKMGDVSYEIKNVQHKV